jgi:phospholipid/cholesterol/gamma-HCH transport system permease protein
MSVDRSSAIDALDRQLPSVPGYRRLESVAGMGMLFVRFVRAAATPPYPWLRACPDECALTIRRCTVPLMISISFWIVGFATVAVTGIVSDIGSPDRTGAGITLGQIRESSYWITSMVFAGVVGSAMTADLGARKIREELDALKVLAMDPMRMLVVPRIIALALMAPVLLFLALAAGILAVGTFGPMLAPGLDMSDFISTSKNSMVGLDVASALLKAVATGVLVGVVCCYKGLSAKGGAEGVGRAVNEAVLITFVALWAFGALWNAVFFSLFPNVLTLRG